MRQTRPLLLWGLAVLLGAPPSVVRAETLPAKPAMPTTKPAVSPVGDSKPEHGAFLIDPSRNPEKLPPHEFLAAFSAFLENPTLPQPIAPEKFQDFWLRWSMITTRYKPDGEELRFTYANQSAAETLAKGQYPFPEGAVLAKIGARAVHDPGFNSSLIPGSIARVQVMIKDSKHPEAQDGWVYALYTPKYRGVLTKDEREACHACHLMVPERDMIFSQPFPVALGAALASAAAAEPFADKFKLTALAKVNAPLQKLLRQQANPPETIMLLEMPTFAGTLFEMREIVSRLTRESGKPHAVSAPDGKVFLVNLPAAGKDACLTVIHTVDAPAAPAAATSPSPTVTRTQCAK